MISNRAEAASGKLNRFPHGDVLAWAKTNWMESISPFMDEFIAAVNRRSVPVDEAYFDTWSPAFLFVDEKVTYMLAEALAGRSAAVRARLMSEVVMPCGQKWQALMAAMQSRVGHCAELETFKTKFALLVEVTKRWFIGANPVWDDTTGLVRNAFVEALGALRTKVCAEEGLVRESSDSTCRHEVFIDRFQAQDYLRDLVARMKEDLHIPSLRQVVKRYLFENGNVAQFAIEVDVAKDLIERWGWKESTVINFTKTAHVSG